MWPQGVCDVERVGVRTLKDHLSEYLSRARRGDVIEVTDRGVPVARLIPVDKDRSAGLRALAGQLNNGWHGGKPLGLDPHLSPELAEQASLSRAIEEDREST